MAPSGLRARDQEAVGLGLCDGCFDVLCTASERANGLTHHPGFYSGDQMLKGSDGEVSNREVLTYFSAQVPSWI